MLAQRLTLDVFRRNELKPIGFANLIDGYYSRVIQAGGGLGLLNETGHATGVRSKFEGEYFESSFAIESGVFSKIHLTHATLTEFSNDSIMQDVFRNDGQLLYPKRAVFGTGHD